MFKRIDTLIKLLSLYRGNNYKGEEIVIIVGLAALSELRARARSWVCREYNGLETFGGARLILEPERDPRYIAIAYRGDNRYNYITEIT